MILKPCILYNNLRNKIKHSGAYMRRSVQNVFSHVKWKMETFIEEDDTKDIVHRTMKPQCPSK